MVLSETDFVRERKYKWLGSMPRGPCQMSYLCSERADHDEPVPIDDLVKAGFRKWKPAFGLQRKAAGWTIPLLLSTWFERMSVHGDMTPPQNKKALRRVFNTIGFASATWAAYVGGFVVSYVALEPVTDHMSVGMRFITYMAVTAAIALAEHLYLQPWHGSRMLKNIAEKHGPKTSAHIYGLFVDEDLKRPRINIPEIARQYGERP